MKHWLKRALATAALASGALIASAGMASEQHHQPERRAQRSDQPVEHVRPWPARCRPIKRGRDQGSSRQPERRWSVDRSVATPLQLTVGGRREEVIRGDE